MQIMDAYNTGPVTKKTLVNGDGLNTITCTDIPESLFDADNAKNHFSKFGSVTKIILKPKKQMCIIEYEEPTAARKALLNAGAYDGFMFDVRRTKNQIRRQNKKDEDPEWLPDSDIEEELSAMSKTPIYRTTRQKPMDFDGAPKVTQNIIKSVSKKVFKEKLPVIKPTVGGTESPLPVAVSNLNLSSTEAAAELYQLSSKVATTPDEQWRLLDARDRILRSWGGTGSRFSLRGATRGTCQDMCPEKERLHRQAEHQVMSFEAEEGCDSRLVESRAVKQYSRSSADQEAPMCYELRPPKVLSFTCSYLLHEIADRQQVSLADWFHFMWDRLRGVRKDITQQALCCSETIKLVEMCARFHAHCAARLAGLRHSEFDQKLNTENLSKCLQTLKHMYADVMPEHKPREHEFRGYVALLNLGDSNFWWEIKQLPREIQKSRDITFAIEVFNAIDNNNYIKFFRLIREKATYLQACILLRYFNDVRARALARIVKAYAPRGGSKFPAQELIDALAFEDFDSMKSFINHYGLRIGRTDDESEASVILDRNQFIDDSEPYPLSRAIELIESKRKFSVGQELMGGTLAPREYENHKVLCSFNSNGTLKISALLAEDQFYDTINDSNKDIRGLKTELFKLIQNNGRNINAEKPVKAIAKEISLISHNDKVKFKRSNKFTPTKTFTFQLPINLTTSVTLKNVIGNCNRTFKFCKPDELQINNLKLLKQNMNLGTHTFNGDKESLKDIYKDKVKSNILNKVDGINYIKEDIKKGNIFSKPNNIFSKERTENNKVIDGKNIFASVKTAGSLFSSNNNNIFNKPAEKASSNIFGKVTENESNVFTNPSNSNLFSNTIKPATNGPLGAPPSNLFQNSIQSQEDLHYSIYKNKNNSPHESTLKSFNDNDELVKRELEEQRLLEEKKCTDLKHQEQLKKEQENQREIQRLEQKQKEEALKLQEEKRKLEEQQRKLEEQRQLELKKKEEEKKQFLDRVNKESSELIEDLIEEITTETLSKYVKDEYDNMQELVAFANLVKDEIILELSDEITKNEMKAEYHFTTKTMKKWFNIWRYKSCRNLKRRSLLEDTPVWLPEEPFDQQVNSLKRNDEQIQITNVISGSKILDFKLQEQPTPEPYRIVDIIKASFLRRMRQINYPYDKCFFWKITLVSPGAMKWMHKKVQIEPWLLAAFSDNKKHNTSHGLIHIDKYNCNGLMDFAISVSLSNDENKNNCTEGLEGSQALLFYTSEDDNNLNYRIDYTLQQKFPYQSLPVAVVLPSNKILHNKIENMLNKCVDSKVISCFKLFMVDKNKTDESMNKVTKLALKWLAKKCPTNPPLEIDLLKSVCEKYLASELWHRLKLERHTGMSLILKDLNQLVQFYNVVLDRLTTLLTNEDIYKYPQFPLEFKQYLDESSPYPRSYEFISSNQRNSENAIAIKELMSQLRLPEPLSKLMSFNADDIQEQIKEYCNLIGECEIPEEVLCKIVAISPEQITENVQSCVKLTEHFETYGLLDLINCIVYDKITRLENFNNRLAIYDKVSLEEYRDSKWWYENGMVKNLKHKTIDVEPDEIDYFIKAKRRKLDDTSLAYLEVEDHENRCLVEVTLRGANDSLCRFDNCKSAVQQLEQKIEEERNKALELEEMLQAALNDSNVPS